MYHNMEEASTLWNYANKKKGIQLESQSLSNNLLYRAGIIKNSPDGPFLRHEFPCFSSSSPSSTVSSLKFSFVFSLPLCSHVVSLSLSLSLSPSLIGPSPPFADLRVDQTLQMATVFFSGATCRTWFLLFRGSRVSTTTVCYRARERTR